MRKAIGLLMVLVAVGANAQMAKPKIAPKGLSVGVTLTGTPTTGTCPYNMNVQWSATNASTCTKSGAWTGTVGASGSATQQVVGATTLTLQCSASTDSRLISWVNPTVNTDGSAAQLGSNRLYHSNDPAQIGTQNPAINLTPATQSYNLTGLPVGARSVAVTAVSTANMESAMSGIATITIVLPVGNATLNATCTPPPVPKPPTGVTIASTVWDTKGAGAGIKVGTDVGYIDIGVLCLGEKAVTTQTGSDGTPVEYWELDKNLTRIRPGVKPRPGILVGMCKLQPG